MYHLNEVIVLVDVIIDWGSEFHARIVLGKRKKIYLCEPAASPISLNLVTACYSYFGRG